VDPPDLAAASHRFVLYSLQRDRWVIFVRGDNARLWDADGRQYLDTMSGELGRATRCSALVAARPWRSYQL
jgi:4-aminobutyrate aminotransferase-like enzyme